jgi:hypothetical protein
MNSVSKRVVWFVAMLAVLVPGLVGVTPAGAQAPGVAPARQSLDVMLLIDNSCSMFPADRRIPGCEVWGNDPEFLRITGASLFIARTGFAQPAAGDYQLGVVSVGDDPPELVSPLQPLDQARDALARAINDPQPKLATQILPALELAYRELRESPNRRPGNLPAIVLLTDGAPFPAQGQGNDEIERLVASYPDVPLFVILLQNLNQTSSGYERYIEFWDGMQLRHNFVRSYPVNSTEEIERTYDEIVARLENTVARPPLSLAAGETLEIFISRYIQRVILTFTRERGQPAPAITITDPAGVELADSDREVQHFRGADNPVEVVAIGRGRLDAAPRDANWRITSDAPVFVHVDMEGSYRVQFVEPAASPTAIPGQLLVDRPQALGQPLVFQIQLVDNATGEPILDPQPLTIRVTNPDGSAAEVPLPSGLQPDGGGIYTVPYDLAAGFAAAAETEGRYIFSVEAGSIADPVGGAFPIARAELLLDVRRAGFIEAVSPELIRCAPGQPAELSFALSGLDEGQLAAVRASAFAAGAEATVNRAAGATFSASIVALCDALAANLSCDADVEAAVRVRAVLPGAGAAPLERDVPARVVTLACTPTPTPVPTATPTPSPTPTPPPTPVPDSDGDGTDDLADRCREEAGWPIAPWFGGCPPPLAAQIAGGLAGLGLLAFLGFYVAPMALVMTVKQPPHGYVQVYRNGKAEGPYKSLRSLGQASRRSTVTIGSKGLLRVPGLEPVELRVERRGKTAAVFRGTSGQQLFQIRDIPSTHMASGAAGGAIVLKFSTDPRQLGR